MALQSSHHGMENFPSQSYYQPARSFSQTRSHSKGTGPGRRHSTQSHEWSQIYYHSSKEEERYTGPKQDVLSACNQLVLAVDEINTRSFSNIASLPVPPSEHGSTPLIGLGPNITKISEYLNKIIEQTNKMVEYMNNQKAVLKTFLKTALKD
ncbi:hypothetical protein CROQUDRAFT_136728 [Cronartium quercuum f. sp. fusiforme G11]|uniref:Uncharacterized protein n=1 Tax=Cronartium quercuum f. sp. fusiforme G11 TaxID=708437 RepID=A0A9P6T6G2_9BASI|nr:hypothetical protein CROQUDRAFT_136728 [Cronartium quercuum f. sp. fusiforme G11]